MLSISICYNVFDHSICYNVIASKYGHIFHCILN
uniref:Uncharacterized protein n=1 Tax=Rhizophora mucronata TaxID=61149 RepID=A0A2P2NEV6_RHIMU